MAPATSASPASRARADSASAADRGHRLRPVEQREALLALQPHGLDARRRSASRTGQPVAAV